MSIESQGHFFTIYFPCFVYLGLKIYVTFNVHLYDYSMFYFGLETELDLYGSVMKYGKALAKTHYGQSICSF